MLLGTTALIDVQRCLGKGTGSSEHFGYSVSRECPFLWYAPHANRLRHVQLLEVLICMHDGGSSWDSILAKPLSPFPESGTDRFESEHISLVEVLDCCPECLDPASLSRLVHGENKRSFFLTLSEQSWWEGQHEHNNDCAGNSSG